MTVFSVLYGQRVVQVIKITLELLICLLLIIIRLIVKLVDKRVVSPLSLASVLLPHLFNNFFIFFRAVMRFVKLLANSFIFCSGLLSPLPLLINECLVKFQVSLCFKIGLSLLCSSKLEVIVELIFFRFTLLLQQKKVVLISLQGSQSCLVCDSHLLFILDMTITQTVVVKSKRSVRLEESRHVCMVCLRNLLAIQSFLNNFLEITLCLALSC